MPIYSDDMYRLALTREYVGPYVFTDGKLEYSSFAGGYFNEDGNAMYYVTDWQGNNVAVVSNTGLVVQNTIYYPYGEPTIEPTGQRYLFGGKEREHAGGRNSYDFGARCLTPYGNWGIPDSLAEKFYPTSHYSYCDGDPINNIDIEGKEKICLSSDLVLHLCMYIFNDDGTKLHIFSHGKPNYISYSILGKDKRITNSSQFKDAIIISSEMKDIDRYYGMEVVLHSCNTGKMKKGKEPIAQQISRDFKNIIITAPDANVSFLSSGREELFRKIGGGRNYSTDYKWRTFFRGNEVPSNLIPLIKMFLYIQKCNINNKIIEYLRFLGIINWINIDETETN